MDEPPLPPDRFTLRCLATVAALRRRASSPAEPGATSFRGPRERRWTPVESSKPGVWLGDALLRAGAHRDVKWSDIATDPDNHVYLTGTLDSGRTSSISIVRKYDALGRLLWTRTGECGARHNHATRIALVRAGGVVVAGFTEYAGSSRKAWVRKLLADGSVAWSSHYALSARSYASIPHGLIVNDDGDIVLVTSEHDGLGIAVLGGDAGQILWSDHVDAGARGPMTCTGVVLTPYGQPIVACALGPAGGADSEIWVRKYEPQDGGLSIAWTRTSSGRHARSVVPWDVASDSFGNVYVLGQECRGDDWTRAVVLKLAPNGHTLWARHEGLSPRRRVLDRVAAGGEDVMCELVRWVGEAAGELWVHRGDGIGFPPPPPFIAYPASDAKAP